ncbi:phosphoribosylglycinamide formyltransferase [candidate division KSB1 bacterium]|nr:phosphoribosylglycinamide formyltransferase [candidate division KSB1 bacterium]RQW10795.1 MAG: phosphoribosylglycinamide formyltransferase [candidate division KSB1 bacterium]
MEVEPIRIVAFASGNGSNVRAIYDNIQRGSLSADLVGVISNNSGCGALQFARENSIPALHISLRQFSTAAAYEERLLNVLHERAPDLIVLAGYMKMMPESIVRAFKNRMLNIHPALLPSFGGRGLYGHLVHEAVLDYGCKVSGVTVHLVDAEYDTGPPVLQRCVPVLDDDTPETLASRVLQEEHKIYSDAIQLFAEKRVQISGRSVRICAGSKK